VDIGVAIAQIPVGFSVSENVGTILDALAGSKPGDVVVTPEGSLTGYLVDGQSDLDRLRKTQPSEIDEGIDRLGREAAQRGVHLWIGVCRRQDGGWSNDAVGLLSDGTRLTYRKVNLATAERALFRAGDELPVFEVRGWSSSIPVGVQLCREARFPEQWRSLAERGAQLFLHLNHGRGERTTFETWRAMVITRAAENQRFLASANAASPMQHCPSIIVAPDGAVIAEIPSGETQLRRAELDLVRTADLYLGQRRTFP
jgi:predicted amidohydrolase